jgi:hypothetical protein
MICEQPASWVRSTQFAGDHPYCDEHALMEEDFGQEDSSTFWKEVDMEKKLYLVETVSIFRMRYVVEAKDDVHAQDEVVMNTTGAYNENWQEFSQSHVDESITSVWKISKDEYMQIFDKDNDYLKDWPEEKKMRFINKIDYKEDQE